MSQPAAPENLKIRVFTQSGSVSTELGSPLYFRSTPMNGHSQGPTACLKGANTGLVHRSNSIVIR